VEGAVEGDAERELIGAGVARAGEELLGRHVVRRAHHRAGAGELAGEQVGAGDADRDAAVVAVLMVGGRGEAEVEDAGAAIVADEHVVGLEVAERLNS